MPSRLLILLHGWTGDENSLWFLTQNLPRHLIVLAPRGLHIAPEGGYTWRKIQPGTWGSPGMIELRPPAEALIKFIDSWSQFNRVEARQIDIIGFSQGAALAYTLLFLHPKRIRALAALSGFMPEGAVELIENTPLAGKQFFIAHGRQDSMIPINQARRSVALLEGSGAQVSYFESDTGHKINPDCVSAMADLFR
jgi:phospholipase/carboxylesterase